MGMKSLISGEKNEESADMPTSLFAYIQSLVSKYPKGIFSSINKEGKIQTLSYASAYSEALSIYSSLNNKGLKRKTKVVLCFDDVLDFIPTAWACILAGYTWIPWSVFEVERNEKGFATGFETLLQKLDNPWIITSGILKQQLNLGGSLINNNQLINIDSLKNINSFHEVTKLTNHDYSNDGEGLISTSGTVGEVKLALLSNTCLLSRIYKKTSISKNILLCFPLHSISGIGVLFPKGAHTTYFSSARLASHPQDLLMTIDRLSVQWLGISSYMAAMLIESIDRKGLNYNLSSLFGVTFGADFIVFQIVTALVTRFQRLGGKNIDLSFVYGMTECGPICSSVFPVKDLSGIFKSKLQTPEIGVCTQGRSLRVVNDNGETVSEGQVGNIQVKSEYQMFTCYYKDKERTKNSFTTDGWFKTGDMGVVKEGKLTLTGRENIKFIINGRSIPLQQLEAPLYDLEGLKQNMVIATSFLAKEGVSEELAIFFVPESFNKQGLKTIGTEIVRKISDHANVNVKHLIPIQDKDIERTLTGKVQRKKMINKYLQGKWQPLSLNAGKIEREPSLGLEGYLLKLWQDILKLSDPPPLNESFFYLGGDSLAAATLIGKIEQKFNCQLPLASFYKDPTIRVLTKLLQNITAENKKTKTLKSVNNIHLLHTIESYVGSWQGSRQFEGSLLVGMNTHGRKTPIFWVFQDYKELEELAQEVGPEQPIYGMRSCVRIIPVKEYTTSIIEVVVNRYLWEILAMPIRQPIILGGNCQGGIIALALAKLLKQIGKKPVFLVLMEWNFSFGLYNGAVLLLYGKQSYTAKVYTEPETAKIDWKNDFPIHKVKSISGSHGQFFQKKNISSLANVLLKNTVFANLKLN